MAAQIFNVNHMCRVCAQESCEQFIPIFEHPGIELNLLSKIECHLPIKVVLSDNLPHQVCEPCICKLNICHDLVETAKAANLKLHLLLNNSSEEVVNEKVVCCDSDDVQCNEIVVTQLELDGEDVSVSKTFQLTNKCVHKKALDDVQFEIAIGDSIEIVKGIDGSQQLQIENDSSNVVNSHEVFEIASNDVNDKLNNLMNEPFSITTSYPGLSEEGSENISTDVRDQLNELPKLLGNEGRNKSTVEESGGKIEENNKRFSCSQCSKVCKSAIGLDVHISTHAKDAPYLCDLCGKNFKHVNSLYGHKRSHLDESEKKKHSCSICNKAFRSKFHLSEHLNIHNGVKPYTCSQCGKHFHKSVHLRQHASSHLSEQDKLLCSVCGSKFTRLSNLQVHIKKCHSVNRTYKCRVCFEKFPTLNQLLSHRSFHSQEDRRNSTTGYIGFPCHICSKVLAKKKSLEVHLQSHSGENKCWCNVCGKELSSRSSLRYHMRSFHCAERSWHCQFCGKGFMSCKLQIIHERSHTGVKPYKCTLCEKAFSSAKSLNQHMQKHTNLRNFECMYCDKKFHRKATLKVHIQTHTGEKPYSCDVCGHSFVQKNDMLKHKKTHQSQSSVNKLMPNESSEKTGLQEHCYSCESCDSTFQLKSDLNKHRLMSHGITIPVVFSAQNNDVLTSITEIITEDGQNILISSVPSYEENNKIKDC